MKIRELEGENRESWDAYASGHQLAWLPHLSGWSLEVLPAMGHRTASLMATDEADRVVGILPLGIRKSWLFGSSLVSVPGASWAGILSESPAVAEILTQAALDLGRRESVSHLELRDGEQQEDELQISITYNRFPIPLEGLATPPRADKQTRRRIRRAAEAGLKVEIRSGDLQGFHSIYLESMARLGSPPFPMAFFEALQGASKGSLEVLFVYHEGTPVATDLLGFWNGLGSSLFAGATEEGRRLSADVVAVEAGIAEALRRGCHTFDLGRSPAGSGGQKFKEHWAVEPTPLHYGRRAIAGSLPAGLDPDRPHWRLARAVWRQLPPALQKWLGSRIAPHLV